MIENLEGEIWKPVVGFEGRYEVSNIGRVKSINFRRTGEERLMCNKMHKGYVSVGLIKEGVQRTFKVHRLVYEAFIGLLPKYRRGGDGKCIFEINHKDEDRSNNRVENLELVSHLENNRYGTHTRKVALSNAKKVYQYTSDFVLVRVWESTKECGRNGFSSANVCKCCNNRFHRDGNNFYNGFHWSYAPIQKGGRNG